jgi:hypothetical protein
VCVCVWVCVGRGVLARERTNGEGASPSDELWHRLLLAPSKR